MRRHLSISVLLALALAVVAGGCGEKDEPEPAAPQAQATGRSGTGTAAGGSGAGANDASPGGGEKLSPEQQIEANVAAVVGGGDPQAACADLVTARYVKRAYGDAQGCRAAVSGQKPFDVAVSDVQIRGAAADARAKPAGGPNKGETLRVELVEDGKSWKVDAAISNAPAGP